MPHHDISEHINNLNKDHPLCVYFEENRYLKNLIENFQNTSFTQDRERYINIFNQLSNVDKRYTRKENQLFPFLEKYGWYGPSQGMWSFHDNIRDIFRQIRKKLKTQFPQHLDKDRDMLCSAMLRMTLVEEQHLLPYATTLLSETDWESIRQGDPEIGWAHKEVTIEESDSSTHFFNSNNDILSKNLINLDVGKLNPEQINLLFKFMPFDITLVDENDRVVFYNRGEDRVFPRSPGVIGREVRFCHPPKSLETVLRIVREFKEGTRDVADFWIDYRERKIHIRYFAMRDSQNNYKGVIEVSQDITDIQKLTGQQRLLNWN